MSCWWGGGAGGGLGECGAGAEGMDQGKERPQHKGPGQTQGMEWGRESEGGGCPGKRDSGKHRRLPGYSGLDTGWSSGGCQWCTHRCGALRNHADPLRSPWLMERHQDSWRQHWRAMAMHANLIATALHPHPTDGLNRAEACAMTKHPLGSPLSLMPPSPPQTLATTNPLVRAARYTTCPLTAAPCDDGGG